MSNSGPLTDGNRWSGFAEKGGAFFFAYFWESTDHPGYWNYAVMRGDQETYGYSRRPIIAEYAVMGLGLLLEKEESPPIESFKWDHSDHVPFLDLDESGNRKFPAKDKTGTVYFIADDVSGCIKIGWCRGRVECRLKTLQCGNSNELTIVGQMAGTILDEHALHRRFADAHRFGEWFRATRELRAFIADISG
jgi:hypothetical protein